MKKFVFLVLGLPMLASCAKVSPVLPLQEPNLESQALKTYYVSDLRWDSAKNGYGPFEKDSSNATDAGGDGQTLTINGVTFAKGLGMTSPAEIAYNLGGNCTTFSSSVGIDDIWNSIGGSVVFQVFADDVMIWQSGLMTHLDPALATGNLSIVGKQKLKLVITDGGDGGRNDFADWANAIVRCDPAPAALAPSDAHVQGAYGLLQDWPLVATHAVLLPDLTVLNWYSMDEKGIGRDNNYNNQAAHNATMVDVWNLNTNQHSNANNTTTDLFCSGFTLTADGDVFVSGGNLGSLDGYYYPGSVHTNVFNMLTKTWSRGPDMAEGRWYPTTVTLPNKEILMIGGWSNETTYNNYIPEVWNPSTHTLRQLSNASTQNLPGFYHLYPWVHASMSTGKVFYSGPNANMAYLDTRGAGTWGSPVGRGDGISRLYGSSVMYNPNRLLIMGGGGNTSTAVTVNLTGGGIQVASTGSMNVGRTHLNATLLPTGEVFVNGGNTSGINFDDTTSVYSGEIWNPVTGVWRLMANADKPRNYHSVALLLPDGRVWTAGGGGCGTCTVNQQSAQIFYPPYLFKKNGSGQLADRPRITSATATMAYNTSYTLTMGTDGTKISKVSLIPLGSVTHAFNMNQRYMTLPISLKTANSVSITSPANSRIAPPGYYMMFAVNSSGVPSVARIVKIG